VTYDNIDDNTIKQTLDNEYLKQLGLTFNTTQISSSVNLLDYETTKGYSYIGNFFSGDEIFLVQATQTQTSIGIKQYPQ
jgi:hypothetical protein